ncbi:MAG: hypothetical protein ACLP07_09310 [Terracidiphilus sp.]
MHTSVLLGFRKAGLLSAGIFAVIFTVSLRAQTASPSSAQPAQPASWFNQQTAEIGLEGFENTTEITPEGYLRTGFGELMFFSGPDLEPTSVSGHILEQRGLPIVHYTFERDGITYRFSIFAGKIDKTAIVRARQHAKSPFMPGFDIESNIYEPQIDFIRVEITDSTREPRRAVFATGVRYQDPKVTGAPHGKDGEAFNPGWMNYFDDANFYRFNRDLYSFPAGFADRSFKIRKNWSEPNPQYVLVETQLNADPTTPIGIVTYAKQLNPGETWTLDFKMPVIPNADPFVISAIDDASLDAIEAQVHGQTAAQR